MEFPIRKVSDPKSVCPCGVSHMFAQSSDTQLTAQFGLKANHLRTSAAAGGQHSPLRTRGALSLPRDWCPRRVGSRQHKRARAEVLAFEATNCVGCGCPWQPMSRSGFGWSSIPFLNEGIRLNRLEPPSKNLAHKLREGQTDGLRPGARRRRKSVDLDVGSGSSCRTLLFGQSVHFDGRTFGGLLGLKLLHAVLVRHHLLVSGIRGKKRRFTTAWVPPAGRFFLSLSLCA